MDPSAEGAAGGALVLVEWPERLGGALPARRLEIRLSSRAGAEGRDAMLTLAGPGWEAAAAMLAAWA
jgi:tRNA A37 threonylcarbamoyladenosine biosynthesis protein TsaE